MNIKSSTLLLSTLLLPAIGSAAQLTAIDISGSGTFNNNPNLIIDDFFPTEVSVYNAATNVHWLGTTPAFTLDFGSLFQIDDVLLSVDNNDNYLVEWSTDAANWNNLFTISSGFGEVGFGMDTMSTVSGNLEYVAGIDFSSVDARYLRISAIGGDNRYSIGELQAFGSVSSVPVPAAAWLFGSGLLGLVGIARRKQT